MYYIVYYLSSSGIKKSCFNMENTNHIPEALLAKLNAIRNLKEGAEAIGSLEEAANAADKFYTLLMKHNLTESEVLNAGVQAKAQMLADTIDLTELFAYRASNWARSLVDTIAEYCLCIPCGTNGGEKVCIMGEKQNVATAFYIIEQLIAKIHNAFKIAWKGYTGAENQKMFRRGFLTGAVAAIRTKLRKEEQKISAEANNNMGLMIVNKKELAAKFAVTKFPNMVTKTTRSGSGLSGAAGFAKGVEAGKAMEISKGLSTAPAKRLN